MWLWREWLTQPPVGTFSQLAPPLCPLKGSSLIWRGAIVIQRTLGILVTSMAFQAEPNRGICCRSGVKETQLQMASYRASSIEKDMPCCRGVDPCTPTLSVPLGNRSVDKPLSRVLIPGFQSLVSPGLPPASSPRPAEPPYRRHPARDVRERAGAASFPSSINPVEPEGSREAEALVCSQSGREPPWPPSLPVVISLRAAGGVTAGLQLLKGPLFYRPRFGCFRARAGHILISGLCKQNR